MKNVRDYNVGKSDYAKHTIQPWDIILEYGLNYWDGDIVKRVLRTKEGEARRLDYEKIIHICKERIRQIDMNEPCYQGEQEDKDETTVFCPSEQDLPGIYSRGDSYNVYSVFKHNISREWYAYLGFDSVFRAHVYKQLTGNPKYLESSLEHAPQKSFLVSTPLEGAEHKSSVAIGRSGLQYELYDYIICNGTLYRYLGLDQEGKFKYVRFGGDGKIEFLAETFKLRNEASQTLIK